MEEFIRNVLKDLTATTADMRDRLIRVEERQENSKADAQHRHANAVTAMDKVAARIGEMNARIESDIEVVTEQHEKLVLRVIDLETARKIVDDRVRRTGLVAGGAGAGVGGALTAIGEAILRKLGVLP